jgi:hypothetical protein
MALIVQFFESNKRSRTQLFACSCDFLDTLGTFLFLLMAIKLKCLLHVCVLIIFFFQQTSASVNETNPTILLAECFKPLPSFNLCVFVNRTSCLSINWNVTRGSDILFEGEVPIFTLIRALHLSNNDSYPLERCYSISVPFGGNDLSCRLCSDISSYQVNSRSKSVDICGDFFLRCFQNDVRFNFSCQHIDRCFWMCPNDCSGHGSCTAQGQCLCQTSYFSSDCATKTTQISCVDAPWLPSGRLCHRIAFVNNCTSINLQLVSASEPPLVVANKTWSLHTLIQNSSQQFDVYCNSTSSDTTAKCQKCLYYTNFTLTLDKRVIACQGLKETCDGRREPLLFYDSTLQGGCIEILNTEACNNSPPSVISTSSPVPNSSQKESSYRWVLLALSVIGGAALFCGIAYCLYKRYKDQQRVIRLEDQNPEDLNDDDDDNEELLRITTTK